MPIDWSRSTGRHCMPVFTSVSTPPGNWDARYIQACRAPIRGWTCAANARVRRISGVVGCVSTPPCWPRIVWPFWSMWCPTKWHIGWSIISRKATRFAPMAASGVVSCATSMGSSHARRTASILARRARRRIVTVARVAITISAVVVMPWLARVNAMFVDNAVKPWSIALGHIRKNDFKFLI